jgi:hypothetical protein
MTLSSEQIRHELDLFEFAPGKRASWATLRRVLPDVETALFFAKAYDMPYNELSTLVYSLFDSPLLQALREGNHSTSLQSYIVDTIPTSYQTPEFMEAVFPEDAPEGEFLPILWDQVEVTIASSIKQVAAKMANVLNALPSKEGSLFFSHMAKLNKQRPGVLGQYRAGFKHETVPDTLVILDVSGSMTEGTIKAIVEDVVALSWRANATLAIVSNTCFVWEPGTYTVKDVLSKAEYGGTQYEKLAPLFDKDWGSVITVADYDSSWNAKGAIAGKPGRIGKVFDISLVNRPTFLAECVGQLADEIEPMLIATTHYAINA